MRLFIYISILFLYSSCKESIPTKVIESRNAFRDLAFEEFEARDVTCFEKEKYIVFKDFEGAKILRGLEKTEAGYKLPMGKISDLEFSDCFIRARLERIQNGAFLLHYEYRKESVAENGIIKDIDKGKIVCTCDKNADE